MRSPPEAIRKGAAIGECTLRILIIEDEVELAQALRSVLERERFVVDQVDSLAMAIEAARSGSFDLVLLDRRLPDGEGLSIVGALREYNPGVAIIVLSAHGEVEDRVTGLDGGADDYLVKPFAADELLARIRAIRRRPSDLVREEIAVGALVFDLAADVARVGDRPLELSRREIRVLAALVRRRGRTVMREMLEQAVFGFDDEIQSNTLDSHVSRLRRKLLDADAGIGIHAVRGVGYLIKATDR